MLPSYIPITKVFSPKVPATLYMVCFYLCPGYYGIQATYINMHLYTLPPHHLASRSLAAQLVEHHKKYVCALDLGFPTQVLRYFFTEKLGTCTQVLLFMNTTYYDKHGWDADIMDNMDFGKMKVYVSFT